MSEHRVIWLQPGCAAEAGEDRSWCQDDAWSECEECGRKSVKYIIATDHEALVKALTDARAAIASLPMSALGYASDPNGAEIHWPIRDELLHRIDTALSADAPVNGDVASVVTPSAPGASTPVRRPRE